MFCQKEYSTKQDRWTWSNQGITSTSSMFCKLIVWILKANNMQKVKRTNIVHKHMLSIDTSQKFRLSQNSCQKKCTAQSYACKSWKHNRFATYRKSEGFKENNNNLKKKCKGHWQIPLLSIKKEKEEAITKYKTITIVNKNPGVVFSL